MTNLTRARELAAARYPEGIRDSMGREHPSIVRRGIMSGQYDGGRIVRQHLERNES